MASLLGSLRNAVWPQPFRFVLEYKEAPSTSASPVAELIHAHCPHLTGALTPPYPTRWLPSGHLQTVYSAAGDFSKVDCVEYKRKVFLTPDGGTVALDIAPPALAESPRPDAEDVPTVVVLHGLTGGSYESYVRNCVAPLAKSKQDGGYGYRCVVINARGCANTPVTSPQLYSASKTADVASALLLLTRMYPKSPMAGVGFSLGGAILAKYIGETGKDTPLIGAVCVGAPYKLDETCKSLESTAVKRVYSYAMGQNLLNVIRRHVDTLALDPALAAPLEIAFGERIRSGNDDPLPTPGKDGPTKGSLRFVDHYVTSKAGGYTAPYGEFPFATADDYYLHASPTNRLRNIARPMLALNADDDPIVPLQELKSVRAELDNNPNIVLAHSRCGGHLGWFASTQPTRWSHVPINEFFAALFDRFNAMQGPRPTTGLGSGGPQQSLWKQDKVKHQSVDVEVLPMSALLPILSGVSPQTHANADAPEDASGEPVHAWLRTHALPAIPLVHPKDSPARQKQNEAPLAPGEMLHLTLYQDAHHPEIGFIELPDDVHVGGNGSIIHGEKLTRQEQTGMRSSKIAGL
ncbi:hypothetical protein GLX27_000850 [Malassezia furfur]|uniref:AB hydrolase-1 domain-containing protein n=1 Tax=Malassezia furfur TaxID=55194 RepID=A0ABY8EPB8_MALFU|nr:hypothetical protein CBS14141_001484 [Malassezia furfur]WFD46218.1 hypothetical protein GLX27_000850 [Malassezia furfur]